MISLHFHSCVTTRRLLNEAERCTAFSRFLYRLFWTLCDTTFSIVVIAVYQITIQIIFSHKITPGRNSAESLKIDVKKIIEKILQIKIFSLRACQFQKCKFKVELSFLFCLIFQHIFFERKYANQFLIYHKGRHSTLEPYTGVQTNPTKV